MAEDGNPYVGPRPFDREDSGLFFGRDRELRELVSLVVSSRVVLLYSASGAGKTSLLNAGVIPLLEQEEQFEVVPPARVRGLDTHEAGAAPIGNVYAHAVLSNWTRELGGAAGAAHPTLAGFLAGHERRKDAYGYDAPRALVFDQFEELFTVAPEHWKQREPFLQQVAEALEADPLLRVVIAMREDYVAQLDPHAGVLPGGLRTRFRLERLGPDAALRAVTAPLAGTDRVFASGVAESLVGDLLTFHVDTGAGEPLKVEGEFAEPVQLQVACHSLWTQLPADVKEITRDHLVQFGDVDEVLARFYDGSVRAAATAAHSREGRLRRAIEEEFITSAGTRGTGHRSADSTGEVPNAAVDVLEGRHVLRAEIRAGARWYELTHDRLIEPIQASNRTYRERRRRKRLRWQAAVVGVLLAAAAAGLGAFRYQQVQADASAGEAQAALSRVRGGATKVFVGHKASVFNAEFQRGAHVIVTASDDGTARIWDDQGEAMTVLGTQGGEGLQWASFSRDGKFVGTASAEGTARIWHRATGKSVAVLRGHEARVATIGFAPDGRVVTSSDDGTARIWQAQGRPLHVLAGGADELYTAHFDEEGRRVVTGGIDRKVRIWDSRTGRLLQTLVGHGALIEATAFDRSGTRVGSTSDDQTARIWTLGTNEVTVLRGHRGFVYAIAFDRSGKHVVTSSADGTARVWELPSGNLLAVLRGHSGEVYGAAFDTKGDVVVTSGSDSTVRWWVWADDVHAPTAGESDAG